MILGVGIDVVHVRRMRRWQQVPGLFERFFHPQELEEALARGQAAVLSLAARFAAKEALGKALGTGLRDIALKDIAVVNTAAGKPEVRLRGTALEALGRLGGGRILVSLSHERDNAIAVVIIEEHNGSGT